MSPEHGEGAVRMKSVQRYLSGASMVAGLRRKQCGSHMQYE